MTALEVCEAGCTDLCDPDCAAMFWVDPEEHALAVERDGNYSIDELGPRPALRRWEGLCPGAPDRHTGTRIVTLDPLTPFGQQDLFGGLS